MPSKCAVKEKQGMIRVKQELNNQQQSRIAAPDSRLAALEKSGK